MVTGGDSSMVTGGESPIPSCLQQTASVASASCWMDDNISDLDRAVLGGGDDPLALTVECYAGDVASLTVEG
jgi:hypothetical protein